MAVVLEREREREYLILYDGLDAYSHCHVWQCDLPLLAKDK